MQYYDEFYESCVNTFEEDIKNMFHDDMKQMVRSCAFRDPRYPGYFRLVYEYVPLKYIITIEHERRLIDVKIEDAEKASTRLSRLEKYDEILDEKNIHSSIKNIHSVVCSLKKVLSMDDIDLYIYTDKKIYVKNKNGIKRVKNWRELVDGWQ